MARAFAVAAIGSAFGAVFGARGASAAFGGAFSWKLAAALAAKNVGGGLNYVAVATTLGMDGEDEIHLKAGRFGPYVQRGEVTEENKKPKRSSLPKGWAPESIDLEKALMDSSCTYSYEARKLFSFNTACGTYLGRLRQRHP